jgi:hypothetical protein
MKGVRRAMAVVVNVASRIADRGDGDAATG